MKLSVSLSEEDVAALDAFAEDEGLRSRSAAVQQAIRRLPRRELSAAYAEAWEEWERSEDSTLWSALESEQPDDASR